MVKPLLWIEVVIHRIECWHPSSPRDFYTTNVLRTYLTYRSSIVPHVRAQQGCHLYRTGWYVSLVDQGGQPRQVERVGVQ